MSNMSYCRFRNTVQDLRDCLYNFTSVESQDEAKARLKLFDICKQIVSSYGDDANEIPQWLKDEALKSDEELEDNE